SIKPYLLLRDALADSKRVAIVKIALRQREQLATLRVRDDVLILTTMLWPDEVREPDFDFLDEPVEVQDPELAMAASLIDSMTGDFAPADYTDDYREALQGVIDAKSEGREIETPGELEETAAAVDLMAALRAWVERARAARRESGRQQSEEERELVRLASAASTPSRRKAQPRTDETGKAGRKTSGRKATPSRTTRSRRPA